MMPSDIIAAVAAEQRAAWLAKASRPRTHPYARVWASLLRRSRQLPRHQVVPPPRHALPGRCT
jgi:hypothetical protein